MLINIEKYSLAQISLAAQNCNYTPTRCKKCSQFNIQQGQLWVQIKKPNQSGIATRLFHPKHNTHQHTDLHMPNAHHIYTANRIPASHQSIIILLLRDDTNQINCTQFPKFDHRSNPFLTSQHLIHWAINPPKTHPQTSLTFHKPGSMFPVPSSHCKSIPSWLSDMFPPTITNTPKSPCRARSSNNPASSLFHDLCFFTSYPEARQNL